MLDVIISAGPAPVERDAPRGAPTPRTEACGSCLLLDEADHRIANHLTALMGYVRLKAADCARRASEPTREDVDHLLRAIAAQLDGVARLHRALSVGHGATSDDLAVHLHGICSPFRESFSQSLELTEDYAIGCAIRPDQIFPLTQVVAEVLTNAMKYAHPNGGVAKVHVRCLPTLEGGAEVSITDDGNGLPDSFGADTVGGLGLRLLRGLAKQLGAAMGFQSTSHGLKFTVTLPPPPRPDDVFGLRGSRAD